MCAVPSGWAEAHKDSEITECIKLFLETDTPHYQKMDLPYCRNKINKDCLHLWRRTNINWTNQSVVITQGMAIAFQRWRPRYSNGSSIEHRWCMCLFLGNQLTDPTTFLTELKAGVKGFADEHKGHHFFYIVKDTAHTYPSRVESVLANSDISKRLSARPTAPAEFGWRERFVWQVIDWS
jgi:hypothetical protein